MISWVYMRGAAVGWCAALAYAACREGRGQIALINAVWMVVLISVQAWAFHVEQNDSKEGDT